jgi:tripartite-type tricarboxylate transporter receptor subunit TctC
MHKTRISKFVLGLAAAAAMLATASLSSTAKAQYYKGKTIEIIVGFSAGGTDTAARIIARRLAKYIPGSPSIVVKNMPGGGSLKAQNFIFERAKPNGLTIGFNPFQVLAQITGRKGVRFSYPKFTFIAGVKGPAFIVVARKDIAPGGLNKPSDINKINKRMSYTGRNPLHAIDVVSTAAFDLLGMKHTYVPGFRGSASITTSLAQSETNITGAGSVHWLKHLTPRLVDKGQLVSLFQFGAMQPDGTTKRDPAYPTVPMFEEFYAQAKGGKPSGELYEAYKFADKMQGTANFLVTGPPKMNPEATEILRMAYAKAMADPATIAEAKKAVLNPYLHIGFKTAKKVMDDLENADAKIVKFWKARVAVQSGAKKHKAMKKK